MSDYQQALMQMGAEQMEKDRKRIAELEAALAEEQQEHSATLAINASLRETLAAFVDANERGPATEWLARVFECHKLAKAVLEK